VDEGEDELVAGSVDLGRDALLDGVDGLGQRVPLRHVGNPECLPAERDGERLRQLLAVPLALVIEPPPAPMRWAAEKLPQRGAETLDVDG
jgi:hypothetical protein